MITRSQEVGMESKFAFSSLLAESMFPSMEINRTREMLHAEHTHKGTLGK